MGNKKGVVFLQHPLAQKMTSLSEYFKCCAALHAEFSGGLVLAPAGDAFWLGFDCHRLDHRFVVWSLA